MPNKDTKHPPECDPIDQAIINAVSTNPQASNNEIGNNLSKVGIINNVQVVYDRLKKRDYLSLEVSKLRDRISDNHTRNVFPLAQKRLTKALKSKEIDEKTAFPYVKLAYDKEMGDKQQLHSAGSTVNIDKMQVILNQALGSTEPKVTD